MLIDDGRKGCNQNHKDVWQTLNAVCQDEWAVVLEDDAVVGDDFNEQLGMVLAAAPTDLVSLYRGHNVNNPAFETNGLDAGMRATIDGTHWVMAGHLLHAVAVCIRKTRIHDMLAHVRLLPANFPIDQAISHWAKGADTQISYCWPSIVDHEDGDSVILRHHRYDKLPRPKGRVAYLYGGRTKWNSEAIQL
jgi:GR25 family glycosyltransferase involved in LPS biosynthesis